MTNEEILNIAMLQSAMDINADIADFTKDTNIIVKSEVGGRWQESIIKNLLPVTLFRMEITLLRL